MAISVRWGHVLTPHQRPHRVDQIYRLRFHAGAVLRAAAEGGLVLRCVAPADCIAFVSYAVALVLRERRGFRGLVTFGWVGGDVLRARKRSSERTAMAFMSRTETGGRGLLVG